MNTSSKINSFYVGNFELIYFLSLIMIIRLCWLFWCNSLQRCTSWYWTVNGHTKHVQLVICLAPFGLWCITFYRHNMVAYLLTYLLVWSWQLLKCRGMKMISLFLFRFAIYFPLRTPVCIQPGSPLEVHFWRCCGSTKVNLQY